MMTGSLPPLLLYQVVVKKKTFRQHRCETVALIMAPGKQIQSSVGQSPFLLQTQLMSHIQSHYFSKRHVANRHMTKLVLMTSDDSRGDSQRTKIGRAHVCTPVT